jgi:hypothetical protein
MQDLETPFNQDDSDKQKLLKTQERLVELAKGFKAMKAKLFQLETVITTNTSIKEINDQKDFEKLKNILISSSTESADLVGEVSRLKVKIENDFILNTDIHESMRAKLLEKEEVFLFDAGN